MENKMATKVHNFSSVITDIQEPLVNKLTPEEKEFWTNINTSNYPKIKIETKFEKSGKEQTKERLESDSEHERRIKKWRDNFLYMNSELKKHLLLKELKEEDERIVWEHGAKLAFQYSNSGHKQLKIVNGFGSAIKILAFSAFVFFCFNIYQETYVKNRQLHLETVTGKERFELIPTQLRGFNSGAVLTSGVNLFGEKVNILSYDEYVKHITTPNFACGELKSLTESFSENNGIPLCKVNSFGDTYIASNINNNGKVMPVLSVIHDGKIYNLDLDKETKVETAKIRGADTVSFNRIQYSFSDAFPEAVREYSSNKIVQNKNK